MKTEASEQSEHQNVSEHFTTQNTRIKTRALGHQNIRMHQNHQTLGRGGFRDDFWSRFGSDLAIAIRHEMGAN